MGPFSRLEGLVRYVTLFVTPLFTHWDYGPVESGGNVRVTHPLPFPTLTGLETLPPFHPTSDPTIVEGGRQSSRVRPESKRSHGKPGLRPEHESAHGTSGEPDLRKNTTTTESRSTYRLYESPTHIWSFVLWVDRPTGAPDLPVRVHEGVLYPRRKSTDRREGSVRENLVPPTVGIWCGWVWSSLTCNLDSPLWYPDVG